MEHWQKGCRTRLPGDEVQTGSLHPFDHPGRRIYPRAVCGVVSKPTAAELVTTPPVRDMRVAFERVRETFPVVIRGGQTDSGSEFRGVFGELLPERGMAM